MGSMRAMRRAMTLMETPSELGRFWILDFGFWIGDWEPRILDFRFWIDFRFLDSDADFRFSISDLRFPVPRTGDQAPSTLSTISYPQSPISYFHRTLLPKTQDTTHKTQHIPNQGDQMDDDIY